MASYPSTTPSFSTRTDGQTIAGSWFNGLQDEVVAIAAALINGLAHSALPGTTAAYDLGSTSVKWRDLHLSRNALIGGTLGVTGVATFTAAPVFSAGFGTLGGDLLFTDATYDIGKSGATRPRDGFFSRNVVVGGTLGVTGASTIAALSATSGTFSTTLAVTGLSTFTGNIKFGTFVSSVPIGAVDGWIVVTDIDGNARKLAVVN